MIRRLFIAASVVSLVLCLATISLWVWSYRVPESTLFEHRFGLLSFSTFHGGVGWGKKVGIERTAWWVNYWELIVLTLVIPLWPMIRRIGEWEADRFRALKRALEATSRRREGFCGTCGYDLRASTERCPECGTPIPAKS